MSMDGYPLGGHHAGGAGGAVRKVLGGGGGRPTMPSDDPGVATGDDLARTLACADAYDAARQAKEKSDAHQESMDVRLLSLAHRCVCLRLRQRTTATADQAGSVESGGCGVGTPECGRSQPTAAVRPTQRR